jgi:hypothetical protein
MKSSKQKQMILYIMKSSKQKQMMLYITPIPLFTICWIVIIVVLIAFIIFLIIVVVTHMVLAPQSFEGVHHVLSTTS